MKQISELVVLLSCFTIYTAAQSTECNLAGQWKNDLGSNMTISDILENGEFSGMYLTAVSITNKTIVKSPLVGFQQLDGSPSFGFTVQWKFSSSVTVFTGQCFINEEGRPVLRTMWLLRSEAKDINDDWKQTRVGYNIFERITEPEI